MGNFDGREFWINSMSFSFLEQFYSFRAQNIPVPHSKKLVFEKKAKDINYTLALKYLILKYSWLFMKRWKYHMVLMKNLFLIREYIWKRNFCIYNLRY